MTPVDPRTLKPGQRVRWTRIVEGTVVEDHVADFEIRTGDDEGHSVIVGRAGAIDTFEVLAPSLPTEVGSTILAALPRRWAIPVVAQLERLAAVTTGWVTADGTIIDPEDITEWALLDGVRTVRDQEPEPQPAREERPCEGCDNHISGCLTPCLQLPTGLGAVVRAKVAGESHPSVLVRTGAADYPWFTEASSGATWRYCGKDLTDVDVLSPGIEVPS